MRSIGAGEHRRRPTRCRRHQRRSPELHGPPPTCEQQFCQKGNVDGAQQPQHRSAGRCGSTCLRARRNRRCLARARVRSENGQRRFGVYPQPLRNLAHGRAQLSQREAILGAGRSCIPLCGGGLGGPDQQSPQRWVLDLDKRSYHLKAFFIGSTAVGRLFPKPFAKLDYVRIRHFQLLPSRRLIAADFQRHEMKCSN
jgi:hypothetical protein